MADHDDIIELLSNEQVETPEREETVTHEQLLEVPGVPDRKEYHLFVCYNQDNAGARVNIIVRNLEQLGYKCCYHERDFIAGHNVLGNVNAAIENSAAILIVLCEDFVNSRFCSHEVEQALHAKLVQGLTIIPIMIEPCAIPETLKYISYIDARNLDVSEMHLKIHDAYLKNEWYMVQNRENNGLEMKLSLTKYNTWHRRVSVDRYKLTISKEERHSLWKNGFQITEEDFQKIETVVNNLELVKYKHIFKLFNRITTLLIFILLCSYAIVLKIASLFTLGTDERKERSNSLSDAFPTGAFVIVTTWLSLIIADGFGFGYRFKLWKGIVNPLTEKSKVRMAEAIWKQINSTTLGKNKFVLLYKNSKFVLLRIDMKPCMDLFERRCNKNETLIKFKRHGETYKAYVKRMFRQYVRCRYELLLQRSPTYPKHDMANGAKCLCQLTEEWILETTNNQTVIEEV